VTGTDPVQVDLAVTAGEGEVTITIDNDLSVQEIRTNCRASEQST
jgi:hypothetical protein